MTAYDLFKNVIEHNEYDLNDILTKLYKLWAESKLSDDELAELKDMAQNHPDVRHSINIEKKLFELDQRITALENKNSEAEEPGSTVYPDYVPGKWYYKDDTCKYNGKNYICIAPEGQVCVWSPDEYPTYWKEVV